MKNKLLSGLVTALFIASPAWAFDAFVVKDIRVEGIQRTEAGTVFNYLPVKVGEVFTEEMAANAIRELFATGFFSDVRIEVESDVIVVVVDERPAIADITFTGVREFDTKALKAGLKSVGLAEAQIFDRSLLSRAEQELKRQYLGRGKYSAKVTTTVTPLERNRVGLNFTVEEGDVSKIRHIKIVGNKAFSEEDLLDLFQLTTPGWFTWYTKNDQYSKQKLSGDLEALRSHYLNQGYLDFEINSTQVSISADKRDIYITVNVSEGSIYTVSGIKFAGDLILPEEDYIALAELKPGDTFSREKLTQTTQAVMDRLGNEGYAFANVNAAPEVDKDKHSVAFTVFVDPGRRVYVNRINITGNSRTRDEVVRREIKQMEGEWFDAEKIANSRRRIDRLGFFEKVDVETPAVPGVTDQVDVNFDVEERATGKFRLGAGFSNSEKVVLSGSIVQENLFGSGKSLTVGVDTSRSSRSLWVSFTDPYYTIDGISLGYDLYHRTYDPAKSSSIAKYKTTSTGAGIRLGYPIAEDDRINFGLSVDRTRITTYKNSPILYRDFCKKFGCSNPDGIGEVTVDSLLATVGWSHDTRDSFLYPRAGRYQRLFLEAALPPGDLKYGKLSYQHQYWWPIRAEEALMLNLELGWAKGYAGKPLPFYKNFYAGGIGTVRGFEQSSIGPKSKDGDALGGSRQLIINAEYFFPLPGKRSEQSFRLSAFVDGGSVWPEGAKMSLRDLRYSAGLALAWSSPVGPLKFSIGYPLKKESDDKEQRFQFQIGTAF